MHLFLGYKILWQFLLQNSLRIGSGVNIAQVLHNIKSWDSLVTSSTELVELMRDQSFDSGEPTLTNLGQRNEDVRTCTANRGNENAPFSSFQYIRRMRHATHVREFTRQLFFSVSRSLDGEMRVAISRRRSNSINGLLLSRSRRAALIRGILRPRKITPHSRPRTPAVLTSDVIYPARLNHLRRGANR